MKIAYVEIDLQNPPTLEQLKEQAMNVEYNRSNPNFENFFNSEVKQSSIYSEEQMKDGLYTTTTEKPKSTTKPK